jgi:hypothetical protein
MKLELSKRKSLTKIKHAGTKHSCLVAGINDIKNEDIRKEINIYLANCGVDTSR